VVRWTALGFLAASLPRFSLRIELRGSELHTGSKVGLWAVVILNMEIVSVEHTKLQV
jgi:hypothetical protein